ncbi:hypothetical protein [Pseudactinotalea terrae]|uniref:hypothetical protein n=1 Tax=Pseudactinotalea terrae TaxID=1743262 RepID=UPI0012E178E2|nr:hypothetical protein [Pseudactinotalea terrae]
MHGAVIDRVLARTGELTADLSTVATRERLRGVEADVARGIPAVLGVAAALGVLLEECTDDVHGLTDEISAAATAVAAARVGYDSAQADMALRTQAASPSGARVVGVLRA